MKVILLGPQRTPTLGGVVEALELPGPIATVTAGWQEREPADDELNELLAGRGVNLGLYQRWLDVQTRDPEYAAAVRMQRELLDEVQELYLVRLDYAMRSAYDVQHRPSSERLRDDALAEAMEAVRDLDARHLDRLGHLHGEFYRSWPPHERPVIDEHRTAVAALMRDAAAVVVTGGHVGVLVEVLHTFNVASSLGPLVIAWSAGAMALTDRIVLFHDRAPQGPGHAEIYGSGLSLLRGVVPLPHARHRLMLDDAARMSLFAHRFAPARCVVLESGSRVDLESDGTFPPNVQVLGADGRVVSSVAA
ncbi:MAG: hypothetical protein ABIM89_09705 [Mycobacteriales bacterium]